VIELDEFESERGVILEELAMADDDPSDAVGERFFEAVFGEHPLGRPIGGSPESIRAVSREAVWKHYRSNYGPRDLVITVAGAVDHDALVGWVTRALETAGWQLGEDAEPVARRDATVDLIERGNPLHITRRPIEQANLLMGVAGIAAADERRPVLSVLNSVLGGGMSSRLFQEVREKRGLAYSVYSFASSFSDAGLVGLYAGCSPQRVGAVAELMLSEFRRLARDGITDEELTRAQGQLGGASALALEDSDTRMTRLGRSELTLGEFADLDETLRRIGSVTTTAVRELAAELVSRPLSVAAVGAIDDTAFAGLDSESAAA
jgi:predicted Zn-dependent peptidase